jgi:hypothetical protein
VRVCDSERFEPDLILCTDRRGFRLHATVRSSADDGESLEQLCSYFSSPAQADERVQCSAAGQVVLKLKSPWYDGTTHHLMLPLEFMQRPATPVFCLRRPAFVVSARSPRVRLLCGGQPRATSVAEGSCAGARSRQSKGCCAAHTGTSRPDDWCV